MYKVLEKKLCVQFELYTEIGASHYVMMGLNPWTQGTYSEADHELSVNCANTQERQACNRRVAGDRVREMGLGGLLLHGAQKLLNAYDDGSCQWQKIVEKTDQEELITVADMPMTVPALAALLRAIILGQGKIVLLDLFRVLWLALLLFSALSCREKDDGLSVIRLTLLGHILFTLLFEANPRYLFCVLPLYCLLAASGLTGLMDQLGKHMKKQEN